MVIKSFQFLLKPFHRFSVLLALVVFCAAPPAYCTDTDSVHLSKNDSEKRKVIDLGDLRGSPRLRGIESALKERVFSPAEKYDEGGAKLWAQVVENSNYSFFPNLEIGLLSAFEGRMAVEPGFLERLVVDWGGGDGVKAVHILSLKREALSRVGSPDTWIEYRNVEHSEQLAELAEKAIKSVPGVRHEWYPANFEKASFHEYFIEQERKTEKKPVVYFLGQTLGNFENRVSILQTLRDSFKHSNDPLLIVGFDLHEGPADKIQRLLAAYGCEEETALQLYGLRYLMMDYGADGEMSTTYEVSKDGQSGDVLSKFVFKRDIEFRYESEKGPQTVSFRPGDWIQILRSHRFSRAEVVKIFETAGLKIQSIETDAFGYALVIATIRD